MHIAYSLGYLCSCNCQFNSCWSLLFSFSSSFSQNFSSIVDVKVRSYSERSFTLSLIFIRFSVTKDQVFLYRPWCPCLTYTFSWFDIALKFFFIGCEQPNCLILCCRRCLFMVFFFSSLCLSLSLFPNRPSLLFVILKHCEKGIPPFHWFFLFHLRGKVIFTWCF